MDVSATSSTSTTSSSYKSYEEQTTLDKDEFLNLFLTELQNQDPLEPMDTSEMTSQLAQMAVVEQIGNLSVTIEEFQNSQSSMAEDMGAIKDMFAQTSQSFGLYSGLIGKEGYYYDQDGQGVSGQIDSIILRENEYYAVIGNTEVPVDQLYKVAE